MVVEQVIIHEPGNEYIYLIVNKPLRAWCFILTKFLLVPHQISLSLIPRPDRQQDEILPSLNTSRFGIVFARIQAGNYIAGARKGPKSPRLEVRPGFELLQILKRILEISLVVDINPRD